MPPADSLAGLPDDYTTQFFQGDVITKSAESSFRGKVLRCWAEEESLPPPIPLPGQDPHPLDRPLLRGEVGIQDMQTGDLTIVPESTLLLYAREFLKGDVVKRSLTAVESAVVTDVRSEVQLEHVINKRPVRAWVPSEKLDSALKIEARDRVVYDEWLGIVEEVFEDGIAETQDGVLYRIAEMGGMLEPGRTVQQVVPPRDVLQLDVELIFPPSAKPDIDKIIDVRPYVLYITWNVINQMLSPQEQEKHPEPKKFWFGEDIKKLTHFPIISTLPPAMWSTVVFKTSEDEKTFGIVPTSHARGEIVNKVFKIVQSRSLVKLRWQDGKETEESALGLVPYHNIDDYESWPGEVLVWRGDNDERRPACVQNYNPHQRIADLLFLDNNERQTVSVLELDPGGGGPGGRNYGAGFGQQVLLCKDNGAPLPDVPVLGQFDTPVDNMWWRNELARLAEQYAKDPENLAALVPQGDKSKVDWWGEVRDLHYDGTLSIKLPGGSIKNVGIKEIFLLAEPAGDIMDDGFGPPIELDGVVLDNGYDDMDAAMSSELSWETLGSQAGDAVVEITNGEEEMDWDDEEEQDRSGAEEVDRMVSTPELQSAPFSRETEAGPSSPRSTSTNGYLPDRSSLKDDESWVAFQMLEEAPEDHHFINEPSLGSSKAFGSRLQKEHRALMSSLPENILVRSYENRTDLLRCLIIGPEGTPYADAPFVFDVYLNPTKFPFDPPLVYFHSHTNGKGRCNPNLYEDGKVCLSILGTWSGDKSESWNPQKSSLLQVFVSISGLVLVRSPYHCEPAFAKLEGTKEGAVNSRLYSEKAYVLSRSFVRTALERPPAGLESEIRHLYYYKGRLKSVIDHAQRLIVKAEENNGGTIEDENTVMWNADAVGSLTMGAILSLKVS
ncbi:hypothetical protein BCR39DRAFT_463825 [Naematelia encephala]|uniref:UBC core domain-containing protein n=1 Tax=Naematelia encephala TaxID=71784 RepID=A0A1Y2BDZ7_9TREE|nr:hypothetical protein BCR39DRAFT_463825 [Naematelia encephala]